MFSSNYSLRNGAAASHDVNRLKILVSFSLKSVNGICRLMRAVSFCRDRIFL